MKKIEAKPNLKKNVEVRGESDGEEEV